MKKWPDKNEVDGETEQLSHLVIHGWCWEWPGWEWVAVTLNNEFGNKRTAASCRAKYYRLCLEPSRQTTNT